MLNSSLFELSRSFAGALLGSLRTMPGRLGSFVPVGSELLTVCLGTPIGRNVGTVSLPRQRNPVLLWFGMLCWILQLVVFALALPEGAWCLCFRDDVMLCRASFPGADLKRKLGASRGPSGTPF